jgi:S-methylmethionine-dependent homocysteine/selenocysteine methylase
MAKYRSHLPQLDATAFLTDGGAETTLIYDEGLELPDFAAFTLLATEEGRAALDRYFDAYARIAARDKVGVVLETATWRASPDWGERLGYDREQLADVNRAAVDQLVGVRQRYETPSTPVVISGNIGPRGDGYQVGELMSAAEAAEYHSFQTNVFASTEADLVTALTMTYPAEAIGIADAARAAAMPVVLSFTVETDGSLPSGESLQEAIEAVDTATDAYPAYYMINCAHPDHFAGVLTPGAAWMQRIGGVRANASRKSHAELDEATELDAGDPVELAQLYRELRETHPNVCVLGGCCGTSDTHIDAISRENAVAAR